MYVNTVKTAKNEGACLLVCVMRIVGIHDQKCRHAQSVRWQKRIRSLIRSNQGRTAEATGSTGGYAVRTV